MIVDNNNIDWSLFQLGKVKRSIVLLYNKEPVEFFTPVMYTPFGIRSTEKTWSNFNEYSIACSISEYNQTSFLEFIEKLNNKIQELVKNNISLFPDASNDFVYNPIFRSNGNYAALLNAVFKRDTNGNFNSFVFDENKTNIELNEQVLESTLSKGKLFKTLIQCAKVWYYNGKVGTIWNINQLKLIQKTETKTQQKNTQINTNAYMIED